MNTGRIIYRYLTALFVIDVLLQFFLAGAGVFSAGPGTAARDSSTLDPHRFNGMIIMLLALLLLIAALAARGGRWKWALALLVLTVLQPVLAIAGAAGGPYGRTIAHGYLTLALGPALLWEVLEVSDASVTVNYGLNRVRFPAPLPVGSRVRADITCAAVEEVAGGLQATLALTFECEGGSKPVCVAEVLFRYGA